MCEPVTLGLAVGSLALGAAGSAMQGVGAKQQADAQADALRQNARYRDMQATDVMRQGATDAGKARMAGTETISTIKVQAGASGVDSSEGTAAHLQGEARAASELDALTISNNAARSAWGLRTDATQMRDQARQVHRAGNVAAGSSILGGIGGLAGGIAAGRKNGTF